MALNNAMGDYMTKLIEWLKLPEVKRAFGKDDISLTLLHSKIIRKKPFLKRLYIDFYEKMKRSAGDGLGGKFLVELGSGGGFIKDIIPNVITTDIIDLPDIDKNFSVSKMPFKNDTVDVFFMFDVLHHLDDTQKCFAEINRCLKPGGRVVMIEPSNTHWGRFIYTRLHHEEHDPSTGWDAEKGSPLFSANSAIPWIIFYRDRNLFEAKFPLLKITKIEPHTPFRYLVSGGVSVRQLLPSFTYGPVKFIELLLSCFNKYLGMFLTIVIEKRRTLEQ